MYEWKPMLDIFTVWSIAYYLFWFYVYPTHEWNQKEASRQVWLKENVTEA